MIKNQEERNIISKENFEKKCWKEFWKSIEKAATWWSKDTSFSWLKGFVPRSEELSFPPWLGSEMVESGVESCVKNVKAYEEVNCREKTERSKGGGYSKRVPLLFFLLLHPYTFSYLNVKCKTSQIWSIKNIVDNTKRKIVSILC